MKTLIFILALLNISHAADQLDKYTATSIFPNARAAMIFFNNEKVNAIQMLQTEDLQVEQIVKEKNGEYEVTYIWRKK